MLFDVLGLPRYLFPDFNKMEVRLAGPSSSWSVFVFSFFVNKTVDIVCWGFIMNCSFYRLLTGPSFCSRVLSERSIVNLTWTFNGFDIEWLKGPSHCPQAQTLHCIPPFHLCCSSMFCTFPRLHVGVGKEEGGCWYPCGETISLMLHETYRQCQDGSQTYELARSLCIIM